MKNTAEYWMNKFKEERERVSKLRAQLERYEDRIMFLESKYAQKHRMCSEMSYKVDALKGKIEILNKVFSGSFSVD